MEIANGNSSNPAEVTVKGWRNGLLLQLPLVLPWNELLAQTEAKLNAANAKSFWRGSQTTIDCGSRIVSVAELDALMDRIKAEFGLVPIALVARDSGTREAGERLALVAYPELPTVKKQPSGGGPTQGYTADEQATRQKVDPVVEAESLSVAPWYPAGASPNALYIPGTIRSGQRIVHDGPVVVFGDVNAGAEVFSESDVAVFGTLRGLAHAGCMGDERARIIAASLRAPQLRIATKIARSPEEDTARNAPARGAEVARIDGGEIQVSPLLRG
jgi:septum site-determining protein MinC